MIPFLSFFFNSCFLHLLLARSSSPWRLLCFLLLGKRIYPSYCVVFISYITAQIVWTYRPSTITSTETSFLFRLVHGALWQPTSGNVDNQQQQVPPPPFANSMGFFLFPLSCLRHLFFLRLISWFRSRGSRQQTKWTTGNRHQSRYQFVPLSCLFFSITLFLCFAWFLYTVDINDLIRWAKEWTRGGKSIKENLEHVL